MKKAFSLAIVLSLLVLSFGTVSASTGPKPVVTPVSGDQDFTVTYLAIGQLPGSTGGVEGMYLPTGYANGEKQFESMGVAVSGFSYGSATACFPIKGITKGWGGQVGNWDGSQWKLLETTISTPAESEYSYACATIYGNGTYALISWIADASLLTNAGSSSNCDFKITNLGNIMTSMVWDGDYFTASLVGIGFESTGDLIGLPATVTLLSASPAGSYGVTGTGSGTITGSDGGYAVRFSGLPMFDHTDTNISYTYHITIGDCYVNYTVIPD